MRLPHLIALDNSSRVLSSFEMSTNIYDRKECGSNAGASKADYHSH